MVGVACVLLALCAGLLPVWALSVRTPFRLIDDYGAPFAQWDRTAREQVSLNLLLGGDQLRFRPTHDLGQVVAWGLFGADARAHHALRLLMKTLAFAALLAVALRRVEASARGRLTLSQRITIAGLAVSLFFYFPNNPEARLAPQELATVMYFMGHLFFVSRRAEGATTDARDVLALACFALALWSKEGNVIPGAVLLAAVLAEKGPWRARPSRPVVALLLGYVLVWLHATVKVARMTGAGGYGRPPLDWSSLVVMTRALPRHVLLSDEAWWIPALLVVGVGSFARLILAAPSRAIERRSACLAALLLAAIVQYLMSSAPVLRYAYPAVGFLVLLTVIGFGLLLVRAPDAASLRRRSLAVAGLACAFALASYRDVTAQFSTQYVAGRTESAALDRVERLMAADAARPFFVVAESEYEARVALYFNRHLPFFFGRATGIGLRRSPAEVSAGAYWLTRRGGAAGFQRVVEVSPPPQPRVVAVSTFLSRSMRLGGAGGDPLLDAGAPPLVPESWFVLRAVEVR